jgi:hypothetical protein
MATRRVVLTGSMVAKAMSIPAPPVLLDAPKLDPNGAIGSVTGSATLVCTDTTTDRPSSLMPAS